MAHRILIAEDSEDTSRLLRFLLEREGYVVTTVPTGTEAYEAIVKGPPPSLLLTDILMPGMTGFELLARLKLEKRLPPTIVLAAEKNEEDVLRGLDYGALDYIRKPFSPREILARVKTALRAVSVA